MGCRRVRPGVTCSGVMEVDLFDRQALDHPYPLYERLRAHQGSIRTGEGHHVLCRYHDVRKALLDHGRFSSSETNGATRRSLPVLVGTDPPAILACAGSPRILSAQARLEWEPGVEARISSIVDEGIRPGRVEAVEALCSLVPIVALAHLMAIEEDSLLWLLANDPTRHRVGRRDLFRPGSSGMRWPVRAWILTGGGLLSAVSSISAWVTR